jgi:phage repressor protein C with HTH and peptisase S24 domain
MRLQEKSCALRNGGEMRFPHNGLMEISEIRDRLKKTGKTQRGLAEALRIDAAGVNRLLKGERQLKASEIAAVRQYLEVERPGQGSVNRLQNGLIPDTQRATTLQPGDEKLRVLGMAEGGPDGWSLWNGDTIEWIDRPANLRGVPDAYAVYVTGSSMEPRYHPGELAHIHPHKPITVGAYVLVQKKPKGPGEPPLAVIKRLVRRSGNRIILEQTSPAKTFEVKADEIVSMHRVVGSSEA